MQSFFNYYKLDPEGSQDLKQYTPKLNKRDQKISIERVYPFHTTNT